MACKFNEEKYQNTRGFCKSVKTDEIKKNNFILTPSRYVGFIDNEDDKISSKEKIKNLFHKYSNLIKESKIIDEKILDDLNKINEN